MVRFLSLLRATLSNDLKLFDIQGFKSRNANRIVSVLLSMAFSFCFLMLNLYAYRRLNDPQLNYIALICGLFMCSIVTLSQAIIKSKAVLFESKDTQMLLSLPLSPEQIMNAYMCKFLILQFLFNLTIYLPTIITYAYFNEVGSFFYRASALGALLLPMIPSLIGTLIGFGICALSMRFGRPKQTETIITIILCLSVVIILDRMDPLLSKAIALNRNGLNGVMQAYLPVYSLLQAMCLNDFSFLCVFVSINILAVIILFWAFAKMYFSIYNRKMAATDTIRKKRKIACVTRTPFSALLRVEVRRFFDSSTVVICSLCSLATMVVSCVVIALRYSDIMRKLLGANLIMFALIKPYLSFGYLMILMMGVFNTCICASSVSLEGNQIEYNRSLPLKPLLFLQCKVCASLMIVYPVVLICDMIFFIRFSQDAYSIFLVLFASVVIPLLNALYGLLINLVFPNMSAGRNMEGFKHGPNILVVSLSGIAVCALNCAGVFVLKIPCKVMILWANITALTACILLYAVLRTWGIRRYCSINTHS